ncbi:hypothetical protein [Bacillus massilinigeriensis]|uniref:hypothetical protein n=1 Tax=Bacillus mediterraneensis TaxID=1805474 RepID=UPI0008F8A9F1|nr:hypothetical protein [Bacillus mediterraneensis]
MRKNRPFNGDLLYVHLNERDHYVLSCGIEFFEFARSAADSLSNILLLKHQFEDGDFNRHTMLQYVPEDRIGKLAGDDVHDYGEFCWLDFEEVDGLNMLSGHQIAELLYLGHIKHHLKLPFYNELGNRFVYLTFEDGWLNKVYYRNLNDFFQVLSLVIPGKLGELRPEKSLLGMRKKKLYPAINKELLQTLGGLLKEGAAFSFRDIRQNRMSIEIPIWTVGDFSNMDDMYDEYQQAQTSPCDAKLMFDKKTKEWSLAPQ